MKIVLFKNVPVYHKWYEEEFNKVLERTGHEIIYYKQSNKEKLLESSKHFQMYERLLDFVEQIEADILIIHTVNAPEILLSELMVRPNYIPKIVPFFLLRGTDRSLARANTFKVLLGMPQVKKSIILSIAGKYGKFPDNWISIMPDMSKYVVLPDTVYHSIDYMHVNDIDQCKEMFNVPKDKFVVLFFGNVIFTKGLDILQTAIDIINDNDIHFLIQIPGRSSDFDIDSIRILNKYTINEYSNITLNDTFIEEDKVKYLYGACDIVVIPYKNEYKYAGSLIANQAPISCKPIIVPNFPHFDTLIDKFNLGLSFDPENSKSLADKIVIAKESYAHIMKSAKFVEFEKEMQEWKLFINIIEE